MHINAVEEQSTDALFAHLAKISHQQVAEPWGILQILRQHMRPVANDEFIETVRSSLREAKYAAAFFLEKQEIYVSWSGPQESVRQKLKTSITKLWQPNMLSFFNDDVSYVDPKIGANDIILKLQRKKAEDKAAPQTILECSEAQLKEYLQVRQQRLACGKPHMLVVEDQLFSRNLMHEVLANNYTVDVVATVTEGWQMFLEHSPDIIFLDVNLGEESGHTLAKSIKKFDPLSFVVMVSADSTLDNVNKAKENKVDGYILKPFSRLKINTAVQNYLSQQIKGGDGVKIAPTK